MSTRADGHPSPSEKVAITSFRTLGEVTKHRRHAARTFQRRRKAPGRVAETMNRGFACLRATLASHPVASAWSPARIGRPSTWSATFRERGRRPHVCTCSVAESTDKASKYAADMIAVVSQGARSGRGVHVARSKASRKTNEATDRALAIARSVRERRGWGVTSANVCQRWIVKIGRERCRVEAFVSAFLEGRRGPGFVFSVTIRSPGRKRAQPERLVSTRWLQGVQAGLGQSYASDDVVPERVSFVRVLRGTTDPSTILDELRWIAAAVEGKASTRRRPKARCPHAKPLKQHRDDVWSIIDALGPSGWRVSSIAQAMHSRVQHDGCRWHVSAGFVARVIAPRTIRDSSARSTVGQPAESARSDVIQSRTRARCSERTAIGVSPRLTISTGIVGSVFAPRTARSSCLGARCGSSRKPRRRREASRECSGIGFRVLAPESCDGAAC